MSAFVDVLTSYPAPRFSSVRERSAGRLAQALRIDGRDRVP